MRKRNKALPKQVTDALRRILAQIGNEQAVDRDPLQVLEMLLYAIEDRMPNTYTTMRHMVREYCSEYGLDNLAHRVKESQQPKQPAATPRKRAQQKKAA